MNPYEILGVNEKASVEAVTERYNILSRKLKENDWTGTPLENDIKFRLRQLDASYEAIIYGVPIPAELMNAQTGTLTVAAKDPFQEAENLIANERFEEATQKLNTILTRNAKWNYMYGVALYRKGMSMDALSYLQQAKIMEPSNAQYDASYQQLQNSINAAVEEEKKRNATQAAASAGCCATGLCGSCLCDACFS